MLKGRVPNFNHGTFKLWIFCLLVAINLIIVENAHIEAKIGQWICKDLPHGTQIPHPEDCHSYFVCDRDLPKLIICHGELHYDARQRVCNWPDAAKCKLGEYPAYWDVYPRPIISTIFPWTEKIKKKFSSIVDQTSQSTTVLVISTDLMETEKPTIKIIEETQTEGFRITKPSSTSSQSTVSIETENSIIKETEKPQTTRLIQTEQTIVTELETPVTSKLETTQEKIHKTTLKRKIETDDTTDSTKARELPTRPNFSTEVVTDSSAIECITNYYEMTTSKPQNFTIGSTDKNGRKIDPLADFDPKNVQCLHNGVYFLPHPGQCQKYFICANHVLYLHSCGLHTNWNYKEERCDYQKLGHCYFDEENSDTLTTKRRPRPPRPPPKKSTNLTLASTTEKVSTPICPSLEQIFIAHPDDCNKYYICIQGSPALTKCPSELWWDSQNQWCAAPEFSHCKAGN